MDSAMIEMSGNIDLVKAQLEEGVGAPMLMKINPDMLPVMVAAVDVEGLDLAEASALIEDSVIPAFERIDGVASVTGMGLLEQRVQVTLDQERIDELNQRVLRAVDADLADAQEQLEAGKQKIADGRAELSRQRKTQTQKLDEAQEQLEAGEAQLQEGLEQAQDGLDQLKTAKQIAVAAQDALPGQIAELRKAESALLAKGQNITAEEAVQLAAAQQGIQELETQLATLPQTIAGLDEQLAQAQGAVDQLEGQAKELAAKKSELAQGRAKLNSELSKAEGELNSGAAELEQQEAQFETARDQAYEKANLQGLITQDMLTGVLSAQNFSLPAGSIQEGEETYLVKVGEQYDSLEQIAGQELFNLEVGDIGKIYLRDVARVEIADNSGELFAKINGNNGVLLTFQKQSNAATAEVSRRIRSTMDELAAANQGLRLTPLQDQGVYIDLVINSVLENLLMGGLLAVLILLIFLRSGKPTFIIALSIPISLTLAVVLMYFSGVTLNIISLAGLALGVGMLVDNSIVVIENIYRLRSEGLSAGQAAVKGAVQVAGAIAASTLTTICVFLPIVFVQGITRQLFTDMGLSIAYSLVASLLIALTLVPALSSTMLRHTKERRHRIFGAITNGYEHALRFALRYKAVVLIVAVGLLAFCGFQATRMGTVFMPPTDSDQISVSARMPEGTSKSESRELATELMERLLDIEATETVGAMQGGGLMASGGDLDVSLYVLLREDRRQTSAEVAQAIEARTADMPCEVEVQSSNMDLSALGGSGVELLVKGLELDQLERIAQDMAQLLRDTEGTKDVSDGLEDATTETRVVVDKNKAMAQGLTVAQVYQQLAAALKTEATATSVTLENRDYPVIVARDSDLTRKNLKNFVLTATDSQGEEKEVKLSAVAKVTEGAGLSAIRRENQVRSLTVSAAVDAQHNIGLVGREIEAKLAAYEAPAGYSVTVSGENETINSTLQDLITMILLAVVLIYLIMVAQFQSFKSPFIVLLTIPLAFTGGLLALMIAGMDISMIAMLGFLMLAGVIVNNGIVFVDYVNQLRAEGMEQRAALVETGRTRLRPILMTALTTVLGLSTLALGMGSGADMLQPMAVVTIGGLIYATLMTLFVVPVMYDLMHRKDRNKGGASHANPAQ